MKEEKTQQDQLGQWEGQLKTELEKRTGRKDIELMASAAFSYKVTVVASPDGHPVVVFNASLQEQSEELASTLDYVSEMLENWEATKILHERAAEDCRPFLERVKSEFPHISLNYNIIDSGKHYLWVAKKGDGTIAYCDLWPTMTEPDIERIILYIRDLEATLPRENAKAADITYGWA